jgi:hypothetical protein
MWQMHVRQVCAAHSCIKIQNANNANNKALSHSWVIESCFVVRERKFKKLRDLHVLKPAASADSDGMRGQVAQPETFKSAMTNVEMSFEEFERETRAEDPLAEDEGLKDKFANVQSYQDQMCAARLSQRKCRTRVVRRQLKKLSPLANEGGLDDYKQCPIQYQAYIVRAKPCGAQGHFVASGEKLGRAF